jgi:hypothetical protein
MPDNEAERRLLAGELQRTPSCPDVDVLAAFHEQGAGSEAAHISSCVYCQTELALMREFAEPQLTAEESAAVSKIVSGLKRRTEDMIAPVRTIKEAPAPWWKKLFFGHAGWLRPVTVLAAGLAVLIIASVNWRQPGSVPLSSISPDETLRAANINITAPVGDVAQRPAQIQWDAVPGAASYTVEILEVDRSTLWSGRSVSNEIALPSAVQAGILPAKTLLLRVTALDAAGKTIVQSELVRFRYLQTFDK